MHFDLVKLKLRVGIIPKAHRLTLNASLIPRGSLYAKLHVDEEDNCPPGFHNEVQLGARVSKLADDVSRKNRTASQIGAQSLNVFRPSDAALVRPIHHDPEAMLHVSFG
jgi:hypothetical protein